MDHNVKWNILGPERQMLHDVTCFLPYMRIYNQSQWFMPVIPEFERLMQKSQEFKGRPQLHIKLETIWDYIRLSKISNESLYTFHVTTAISFSHFAGEFHTCICNLIKPTANPLPFSYSPILTVILFFQTCVLFFQTQCYLSTIPLSATHVFTSISHSSGAWATSQEPNSWRN